MRIIRRQLALDLPPGWSAFLCGPRKVVQDPHWMLMELSNYRRYREPELEVRFWRTSTGLEVDFVLGEMVAAIEVKGSTRVHAGDLGGLRALRTSHRVKRAMVVSLEKEPRTLEGIEIMPWRAFLDELWAGRLTA